MLEPPFLAWDVKAGSKYSPLRPLKDKAMLHLGAGVRPLSSMYLPLPAAKTVLPRVHW